MKKTLLLTPLLFACILQARVVDVSEYGILPGRDVTLQLNALIASLKAEDAVTLYFPQGQYDFYPDNAVEQYRRVANHDNGLKRMAFPLFGHRNLTIEGNGSVFMFHGRLVPFTLEGVSGVSLKNFVIDFIRPFHAELKVVEQDAHARTVVVETDPAQYPYSFSRGEVYFDRLGQRDALVGQNILFDPATRAPIYRAHDYRMNPATLKAEPAGQGRIKLINAFETLPPVGSVLIVYGNTPTSRLVHAIQITDSRDILIENVTVRAAGGMGLIVERTKNIKLDAMRVTAAANRLVSTRADATHFIGCKGLIELENCVFEHMLDDGINVHGAYVPVVEHLEGSTFLCEISHFQQWGLTFAEPGDKIAMLSRRTVLPFFETTVSNIRILNERRFLITLAAMPAELPEVPLSLENLTWNPDLVMRGNTIRENRARSVLVTTKGRVLIEDNYFSSQMHGILIEGDNHYWYESGAVGDVVIRNNTFRNIGFGGANGYPLFASPKLTQDQITGEGHYHRNIAFTGNTIHSFNGNVVDAKSVENLTITNNTIHLATDYPTATPQASLRLEYCRDVTLQHNTAHGFATPLVVQVAADSDRISGNGNSGFDRFGTAAMRMRDLSAYEAFTDGFPRTLLFRNSNLVKWQEAGQLDRYLGMFDGDTRKYVGEETPFKPEWIDLMADFKRRHPGKLSLIHLNGEARGVLQQDAHKYFPGHWTFYPGETLSQDLSAQEQRVRVSDPALFSNRSYRKRERGQLTDVLLPPVIIVPLLPDGSKDWANSEYAAILAIDAAAKTLKLSRGQYFSQPRAFAAGKAYIAPIHSEYWGSGTMWTLNLSSASPRDPQGRTAADIWVDEITAWCGPGGLAQHVDGIGFDVIFFKAKFPDWDLDADGKSDAGVAASGEDFNTSGQYQLLRRLREAVGPDFILTSDGWDDRLQRAVGIFNGMESEGLAMPNDGWRKIAQTINSQRYWAQQGNAKYSYSYITAKLEHPQDKPIADQLYRMGLGTASALGVAYTNAAIPQRKDQLPMIPEMHRGAAMQPNWLGQPLGEMVLLPKLAADILGGAAAPFSQDLLAQLETENCTVTLQSDGSLLIVGTADNPYQPMVVTLRGLKLPAGDLSVFFDALALDPLSGYGPADRIPRHITVHADGMPAVPADQVGRRPMYNDILAFMGTAGWQENCAYFRNAGAGRGTIDLSLRFENQGACKLRNLTAHSAPMAFAREFEHGLVLVNASQQSVTFDLAALFPHAQQQGLWRIKADPRTYVSSPATDRMLQINNGRKLDSPRVNLPALEGFFLCKSPQ